METLPDASGERCPAVLLLLRVRTKFLDRVVWEAQYLEQPRWDFFFGVKGVPQ